MKSKCPEKLYFVFRVLVGLMFMQHGSQKLFGWLGSQGSVELFSLMGLAGVIEFFGGLLIVLGLFTRAAAGIAAIEMVVAYFRAHASNGLIPIQNRGELVVLFFAAFLVLAAYGSGKWGLGKALFKKELL
jgi:putative oxidoreductase